MLWNHINSVFLIIASVLMYSFMSTLVSNLTFFFQEVNAAVTKINELIRQRGTQGEHANQFFLDQKDVQSLELGAHLIS